MTIHDALLEAQRRQASRPTVAIELVRGGSVIRWRPSSLYFEIVVGAGTKWVPTLEDLTADNWKIRFPEAYATPVSTLDGSES